MSQETCERCKLGPWNNMTEGFCQMCLPSAVRDLKLQLGAARKFYDWYMNAGSWSDVGLDASSGTRWVLSVKEALEGDRLTEELDRVTGWDKPITEKREGGPKCDHSGIYRDGDGVYHCAVCHQGLT